MKSIAILLDGGFVEQRLRSHLGRFPTADDVYAFAKRCKTEDEEIFRIYYYDCPPLDTKKPHPLSGKQVDFGRTDVFERRKRLLRELCVRTSVALREGVLSFDGLEALAGRS